MRRLSHWIPLLLILAVACEAPHRRHPGTVAREWSKQGVSRRLVHHPADSPAADVLILPEIGIGPTNEDEAPNGLDALVARLRAAGLSVWVLDRRAAAGASLSTTDCLADGRRALDHLSSERPRHLIGWGLGGWTADHLAATGPGVASLTLVATPLDLRFPTRKLQEYAAAADSLAEPGIVSLWGEGPGRRPVPASLLKELTTWLEEGRPPTPRRSAAPFVPTLIVTGRLDWIAPPECCIPRYDEPGPTIAKHLEGARTAGYSRDYDHLSLILSREAEAEIHPSIVTFILNRTPE